MANRRVTATTDPLVVLHIYVPKSQKAFLDSLDGSASDFIRKLIESQMDGHEVEIARLEQEERQLEAQLNIVKAQLRELRAESDVQQNAIEMKENLINSQVDDLYVALKSVKGRLSKLKDGIAFRVKAMNQKLNGSGATVEPITIDEITQKLTIKAKAEGLELW